MALYDPGEGDRHDAAAYARSYYAGFHRPGGLIRVVESSQFHFSPGFDRPQSAPTDAYPVMLTIRQAAHAHSLQCRNFCQ